jgi:Zn-dependent protease
MFNVPQSIMEIAILAPPILLAVTSHEVAHGYVADKLGDPTARLAGRLTLNPLKHLDVVGTLVFFITRMIGWAKPVPINPYNLKNPKKDMMWVALAGPCTNLALAVICSILYRAIVPNLEADFNQLSYTLTVLLAFMLRAGVMVNVGLAVFNVIPIPPLDGSRVVAAVLPPRQALVYSRMERYGFLILLALVFTGALDYAIFPVTRAIIRLLLE